MLTVLASVAAAETSLSVAQAAVESNLRTPEGKAYDDKMGTVFAQEHLAEVRQCKKTAGGALRSFWFLIELSSDGHVKEILLYPVTTLGSCSRDALLKDQFPSPPRGDYWVSIYMKLN